MSHGKLCLEMHTKCQVLSVLQVGEHLDVLSPQPAPAAPPQPAPAASQESAAQPEGADNMDTDAAEAPAPQADTNPAATQEAAQPLSPQAARHQKLRGILTGSTPIQLYLEFLYTHNHADVQILRNMKGAVEARNSVCHSAVIFANASMHSGTTVDAFLRENLDWLSRATNWAKFNATAGLGVIHRYWTPTAFVSTDASCCKLALPCFMQKHPDACAKLCCRSSACHCSE